jgi:hypothetical protein
MNRIVKNVLQQSAGVAVGVVINKAIDKQLAKSKNPGWCNRNYRKLLAFSRKPSVVAFNLIASVIAQEVIAQQIDKLMLPESTPDKSPEETIHGVCGVCSICQKQDLGLLYKDGNLVLQQHVNHDGQHCSGSYDYSVAIYAAGE